MFLYFTCKSTWVDLLLSFLGAMNNVMFIIEPSWNVIGRSPINCTGNLFGSGSGSVGLPLSVHCNRYNEYPGGSELSYSVVPHKTPFESNTEQIWPGG